MYYVKTVYAPQHFREPNIQGYETKEDAQLFIDACLKWGIGIVSCDFVEPPNETGTPKSESESKPAVSSG